MGAVAVGAAPPFFPACVFIGRNESNTVAQQAGMVLSGQRVRARCKVARSYPKRLETIQCKCLGGQITALTSSGAAAYSAPGTLNEKRNDAQPHPSKIGELQ